MMNWLPWFLLNSTSPSTRMPVAATRPNITIPAPPSTLSGTAASTCASLGSSPRRVRKPPAAAQTYGDETPVMPTRPTFCEKEVYGNAFQDAAGQNAEPVRAKRLRELSPAQFSVGHTRERKDDVSGFDKRDDHDERHGQDRHNMKGGRAELKGDHEGDPRALTNPATWNSPNTSERIEPLTIAMRIANDWPIPRTNRAIRIAARKMNREIASRSTLSNESLCRIASTCPIAGDRQQRQPDQRDDGAADDSGE
jgi:hypothetical protein